MIVYCWKNLINGKEYIGSDSTGQREIAHLQCISSGCKNGCTNLMHKAVRKDGLENFQYFVLESGFETIKALREAEYRQIEDRNSLAPFGYNLASCDNLQFSDGPNPTYEMILDYIPPTKTLRRKKIPVRRQDSVTPLWINSDSATRKILLEYFPGLKNDPLQRRRAGKCLRAAYLFYRTNLTLPQIAEEMESTVKKIKATLKGLRRVVRGRTASNTAFRGLRPPGRPKNTTPPGHPMLV